MDQRYSTIIFVPHARAKFRKLKVSHRLLISLVSLVTSSLCLSTFFSVQYFTSLSQTHELTKLRSENKDLQSANEQFSKSVESLRTQLRTSDDAAKVIALVANDLQAEKERSARLLLDRDGELAVVRRSFAIEAAMVKAQRKTIAELRETADSQAIKIVAGRNDIETLQRKVESRSRAAAILARIENPPAPGESITGERFRLVRASVAKRWALARPVPAKRVAKEIYRRKAAR